MTAQGHADRIWARNATTWPCVWCNLRSFATERGRDRHELYCRKNPAAKCFTEGGPDGAGAYEALFNPHGDVVGMVSRGDSELDGARIKREMQETLSAFGIQVPT